MRGNQVEFLTKKLNLTPDQVTQVKAIEDGRVEADDGVARRHVDCRSETSARR